MRLTPEQLSILVGVITTAAASLAISAVFGDRERDLTSYQVALLVLGGGLLTAMIASILMQIRRLGGVGSVPVGWWVTFTMQAIVPTLMLTRALL